MINYQLAKELKEVGFPHCLCLDDEDCRPNLSDLIKEVGDDFVSLERFKDNSGWKTRGIDKRFEKDMTGLGKTPEEALARLWLEINKNGI